MSIQTRLILLFLSLSISSYSQDYTSFRSTLSELTSISNLTDTAAQHIAANSWWNKMKSSHNIPFAIGDSVAFLYRGDAKSVEWMGDFNGWGYMKEFKNKGTRIAGTNIWELVTTFPSDARLDYKVVVNGSNWILDPENQLQQWSGIGGGSPNSELAMPKWKEDAVLLPKENIAHAKVTADILYNSKVLGYQIMYSVYIPSAGSPDVKLPTLYVTDGYEYMHPRMGNMITVLDNLIAEKKIKPIIVIFIDHREPVNRGNNKRMDELAMNPKYLTFFTDEFIPLITKTYPVKDASSERAIMGASMGGLNAAYFAFSKPGVFGMAGIQSPSFWIRPQIYTLCNNPAQPVKVSMTSGVINDTSDATRKMKDVLQTNACVYKYHEVNEGHSWGNWRNLIDDVLVDLFGI